MFHLCLALSKLDSEISFREHQVLESLCWLLLASQKQIYMDGMSPSQHHSWASSSNKSEQWTFFDNLCQALAKSFTWIISFNSHHSHKLETTVLSPLYRHTNWGNTGFSWRQWESGRWPETAVFMVGVLYPVKGLSSRNFWRKLETKKDPANFLGYKSLSMFPISYL